VLGLQMGERMGKRGGVWLLTGEAVSVTCRDGRGVLGVHWPGWAVAPLCRVQACTASELLEGRRWPKVLRQTRRFVLSPRLIGVR
jgi:hypothetical protein